MVESEHYCQGNCHPAYELMDERNERLGRKCPIEKKKKDGLIIEWQKIETMNQTVFMKKADESRTGRIPRPKFPYIDWGNCIYDF